LLIYLKEVILDVYENKNAGKEDYGTMTLLQALFWIQTDAQSSWITELLVQSLEPASWSFRGLMKNQGADVYQFKYFST